MNSNYIIKDFIFGMLAAYVPIMAISSTFKDKMDKNGINYASFVRWTPFMFGIINAVFMALFRSLGIHNFIVIGAIFSIIYSGIGRFYAKIPTLLFEMKDPNMFHLYALVTWTLFYGIFGSLYYNL